MNDIGQRLLNEANFIYEDRGYYFSQLIKNPSEFLTWEDVEICLNNPAFYEFEFIDHNSNKIQIDRYIRAWIYNKKVQDSCQMVNHINHGHTMIIMNYGYHNRKTQELLNTFERIFDVDAAIHVYGGLQGSKSFNIHDDYPCNFIVQVEGTTKWKIYKNRISSLYKTGTQQQFISEDKLEIDIEVELSPGDALYIPARAYHCAFPTEKRLSMSIPCWPRMPGSNQTPDRNYYKVNYE
jgi:hypothetical protein